MPATNETPRRVLIVDNDVRVRRALVELINATDGFTVVGAAGTQPGARTATGGAGIAVVGLRSTTDRDGLQRIRALTDHMPVVAVSTVGSAAPAATRAGAISFYEMDGDTDALINALKFACESWSQR